MLESPDYFFRVREIGRQRQTIRRVEATTALHNQVIPEAEQGISSAARSARAQNKWNAYRWLCIPKSARAGVSMVTLIFHRGQYMGFRSTIARNLFKLGKV